MSDREKVIRGLELCAGTDCIGCPYRGVSPCQNKLAADALALLKEQEARVMMREEIEGSDGTEFYSEHKGEEYLYMDHIEGPVYIMGNMERFSLKYLRWEDYGKTWRCWTSRPTPEQMRETKWEKEGSDAE